MEIPTILLEDREGHWGYIIDEDTHLYVCDVCAGNFAGYNVVGMEADRESIRRDMLFYGQRIDVIRTVEGKRMLHNVSTGKGLKDGDETVHCPICHAVHYAGFSRRKNERCMDNISQV